MGIHLRMHSTLIALKLNTFPTKLKSLWETKIS